MKRSLTLFWLLMLEKTLSRYERRDGCERDVAVLHTNGGSPKDVKQSAGSLHISNAIYQIQEDQLDDLFMRPAPKRARSRVRGACEGDSVNSVQTFIVAAHQLQQFDNDGEAAEALRQMTLTLVSAVDSNFGRRDDLVLSNRPAPQRARTLVSGIAMGCGANSARTLAAAASLLRQFTHIEEAAEALQMMIPTLETAVSHFNMRSYSE